ncbi:sigma-54-dependent transcriptional regulator [Chitinasiproducens palmae]|uniref:DNA-binding transcriptional response regulator, NtrC family, contains REC, AAA-type ATPase, and a Fis-type DNA-binding domains n=1 Tax=Chitinasiproducens palmae TaxID=1770053 RepID=A0A1H2PWR0_9BURK|nr:sigma-54 dependent transcriptional regulator [Chitinasiproducens palmae]SDV50997.1 DNA-binding transcriptional response regulator, NtrC family, contains REC, AAA-type ATPase, and a Fis-type DNA-binding domains [Chitinasiproducens palmae]
MPHALIVEDDPNSLSGLAAILEADDFSVDTAATLAEAKRALSRFIPDIVLIDLNLPDGKGLDLLPHLPLQPPNASVPVIVMTGNATVESAIEALRHGIWDYLLKPVSIPRLRSLLARIPRPFELTEQVQTLKAQLRQLGHFGPMVGRSQAINTLYDSLEQHAGTEHAVLLVGESGAGKQIAAKTLHQMSRRRKGAFVSFDCRIAASSRPFATMLFGQEQGGPATPFLSADGRAAGALERASGGTLFLDELTQLPIEHQHALAATLRSRTFQRLGGSVDLPADFRVIASTTQDPQRAVAEGRLRQDLYLAFEASTVSIPPLRERREDVAQLAHHFVDLFNQREGGNKRLAADALAALEARNWSGNVKELRDAIEQAYRGADDLLTISALDGQVNGQGSRGGSVHIDVGTPLADVEEMLIRATLDAVGGTRHRAASMLGISPKTLYNKLQRMKY